MIDGENKRPGRGALVDMIPNSGAKLHQTLALIQYGHTIQSLAKVIEPPAFLCAENEKETLPKSILV